MRVALKGQIVFNIEEIFDAVRVAEVVTAKTKAHRQERSISTTPEIEDADANVLDIEDSDGGGSSVAVALCR